MTEVNLVQLNYKIRKVLFEIFPNIKPGLETVVEEQPDFIPQSTRVILPKERNYEEYFEPQPLPLRRGPISETPDFVLIKQPKSVPRKKQKRPLEKVAPPKRENVDTRYLGILCHELYEYYAENDMLSRAMDKVELEAYYLSKSTSLLSTMIRKKAMNKRRMILSKEKVKQVVANYLEERENQVRVRPRRKD